jgi:hypothetical protein
VVRLVFGLEEGDFVKAEFGDRPYPHGSAIERNMVSVRLDVSVAPFRGTYEATWLAESLLKFRQDLEQLYEKLDGEATLRPDWDRSLELRFIGDGLGHISIKGEVCANAVSGPWLRFQLPDIDQTYLPELIGTLVELEGEYPIT